MKSVEPIENLILRFPAIAREAGTVDGFWAHIEFHMQAIRASAKVEAAVEEIGARYGDLVEMVNDAGLVRLAIN